MKFAILIISLATFVAAEIPEYNTAYGYLTRFGVPEAKRIRAREEAYFRNPVSRIFNGSPAGLGQFPYQAGLLITLPSDLAVCGAILVRNNRLLTAAHCWFDGRNQASLFEVVLGSITLFSGGTRIRTNSIAMHPSWSPSNARNDIAVIYLPSSVLLSSVGIASNQFLSFASMNIITNNVCSLSFPFLIQSSNICVNTANSASTCGGDSGGPLVVQRNGAPLLVGITSFGAHLNIGGCESGRPAAFARVTSFMSFINQNI